MKYCPNCGKAGVEGMKFCPQCGRRLMGLHLEEKQRSAPKPEAPLEQRNWFEGHLNWTWVFAYLIWLPLNLSYNIVPQVIGAVFLLFVSGWVIKQKGRTLWWILLSPLFSPLWLKNKRIV
ncbi:MAG: zinc ribbon domain-containing protein, partial [Dehalococcoidia bacterium]|nr:zinc ribbon domain-containing protein [Dehalococcoidia bacterium]